MTPSNTFTCDPPPNPAATITSGTLSRFTSPTAVRTSPLNPGNGVMVRSRVPAPSRSSTVALPPTLPPVAIRVSGATASPARAAPVPTVPTRVAAPVPRSTVYRRVFTPAPVSASKVTNPVPAAVPREAMSNPTLPAVSRATPRGPTAVRVPVFGLGDWLMPPWVTN